MSEAELVVRNVELQWKEKKDCLTRNVWSRPKLVRDVKDTERKKEMQKTFVNRKERVQNALERSRNEGFQTGAYLCTCSVGT